MMRFTLRLHAVVFAVVLCHLSFADEADMASGLGDTQLAALGQQWADAINLGDAGALNGLLDLEAIGLRSAKTFSDKENERNEFVRGFTHGGATLAPTWISQIQAAEGRALFLRVHTFDGMRGPLVRYDLGEQGYNYVLLISEKHGDTARVVDMFIATTGQRLSDTLGAVSLLMVAPNPTVLDRLFGVTRIDSGLVATFKEIGQLQRAGRIADAYAKLTELPEGIRNQRVMLNVSMTLANQLGEAQYREELARLARHYKDDPTAAFSLIDYYFFEGDTQSAIAAVAGMERAFGNDAAIAMLKANISIESGDLSNARRYAQQAVDLEPDNEDSRWTLVTSLMLAEQYAAGVQALESLEQDFGYELDPASFGANEIYSGFVQSPEYAIWRDAHR